MDWSLPYSHPTKTLKDLRPKRSIPTATRDNGSNSQSQNATDARLVHRKTYSCRLRSQFQLPPLLRIPQCPEVHLSGRLGALLSVFHWDQMWTGLVPARIGYWRSVDLAVSAFLELHTFIKTRSPAAKASSLRHYLKAIAAVQALMSIKSFWTSEEAQIAVGLLSAYEITLGASLQEKFAHKQGLLTLLVRSNRVTEVVRAMAHDDVVGAYLIACARGEESSYDNPFWLSMDPISRQAPTYAAAILRKIHYHLHIRLPKLIILLRRLRTTSLDWSIRNQALSLAYELLLWKDQSAENELLHSIKISKLCNPDDTHLVPYGMQFGTLAEFSAAVCYWEAIITLNRICIQLERRFPGLASFDPVKLEAEDCRMAKNLLMTWHNAFACSCFGIRKGTVGAIGFIMALVCVWGILLDVDTFNGHNTDKVRLSVLEWSQMLQSLGIKEVTSKHMDEMADMFVGGPVEGLIPLIVLGRTAPRTRDPSNQSADPEP